jgi:4'-phosphopantetheinyl transferase
MQEKIHFVPDLPEGGVHVWRIPLMAPAATLAGYQTLLAPDERARAARFHFDIHRHRFAIARARMRMLLSSYSGCTPAQLVFSYTSHGKPYISHPSLRFNLSHADDIAILGVTRNRAIGVDIEHIRADFATDEIANRHFSKTEVRTLRALAAEERCSAFFRCWTRKEAYIKALGEGLSMPLGSFDVCLDDDQKDQLWLSHHEDPNEQARWQLRNVPAPQGYFAAAVVEGHDLSFQYFDWSDAGMAAA